MSAPLHRIGSPLKLAEILESLEETALEYTAADIYICPPDNDDPHNITDEESGEEDSNDPDRVCRRQLQAEAEIRFEEIENDEDTLGELGDKRGDLSDVRVEDRGNNLQIATHSKATRKRKPVSNATHKWPKFKKGGVSREKPASNKKMNPVRNWEKGNLEIRREVAPQCEMGPPVLSLTDESHPLLEFFQCFMPED
ncbi:hypothetical protein J6590_082823 [Homalodisca vitripennis]|nr:hypothetical protein J6590_082823 [Homalodisca vitripennis]